MIKNICLLFILLFSSSNLATAQPDFKKINGSNTWLKLGVNAAAPILDFSQSHRFGLGLDASLQFLETKASGIGIKAGLLNYFGKGDNANIQALPLALMFRYYPKARGWFAGTELGYAFLNGLEGTSGGFYFRPQLGLHFDYWNYFIYYDHILTEEPVLINLQAIGIGITYNLRFKK
jgi:hypothetical protein